MTSCLAHSVRLLPAALVLVGAHEASATARIVVTELFGTAGCAPCSQARAALASLSSEMSGQVVWMEIHTDPGTPMTTTDGLARASRYGISQEPTARFDGSVEQVGGSDFIAEYRSRIQDRLGRPQPLTLNSTFFFDGASRQGAVTVDVRVDPDTTIAAPEEVSIRAFVLEDGVAWCCGAGGTAAWPRVVRLVLETPLSASLAGQRQSVEIPFSFDESWEHEAFAGVVLVQRDSDLSILAAAEAEVSAELQPVPFPGVGAARVTLFPCRPNPMRSQTLIEFFLPEPDVAKLRIMNGNGQVVRVLTDGPRTRGLHPMSWNGRDWRGRRMAAGIYFFSLETSTERETRRLVLLP